MTPNPGFKATVYLQVEYLTFSRLNISETTRDRPIVTIERQQEVTCSLSHGDISNHIDGPYPSFQGHGSFEVEYRKKTAPLKDKVTIAQEETIYLTYGMVLCLVTLTDY